MYNQIEILNVDTPYQYKQFMWIIDGKPLSAYLEDMVKEGACEKLVFHEGTLSGLCPAGCGHMLFSYEREFVWELYCNRGEGQKDGEVGLLGLSWISEPLGRKNS